MQKQRILKLRAPVRAFAIRFGIALAVCGGVYLLFFVWHPWHHSLPKTTAQKVAALRGSLDQLLITGSSLANYSGNNATSADTLASEFSDFQANITDLQKALKNAPIKVDQTQRQQIQAIIGQAQSVAGAYSTSYKVLGRAIAYDPGTDLGRLSLPGDLAKLQSRAQSAQTGLNTVASSTATTSPSGNGGLQANTSGNPIVSTDTQHALQNAASCFGNVAKAPANTADSVRKQCIKEYSAVRKATIQNLLADSFSANYLQQLQSSSTPVLQKLDRLIGR